MSNSASHSNNNHILWTAIVTATVSAAAATYATTKTISKSKKEESNSSSSTTTEKYPKLKPKTPVPSDIQISQDIVKEVGLLPTEDLAKDAGILNDELYPWGISKAKVSLKVKDRLRDEPNGNYVVVTGINPTPLGEGKSSKYCLFAYFQRFSLACVFLT
jgi:hypothetical protein